MVFQPSIFRCFCLLLSGEGTILFDMPPLIWLFCLTSRWPFTCLLTHYLTNSAWRNFRHPVKSYLKWGAHLWHLIIPSSSSSLYILEPGLWLPDVLVTGSLVPNTKGNWKIRDSNLDIRSWQTADLGSTKRVQKNMANLDPSCLEMFQEVSKWLVNG